VTVGRFDGYLAETRKYGFTLITVLLTANALITTSNRAVDRPAASIVIMVLLLALFMIDNFYWVMLKAAVKRAKDLEASHDQISWQLSFTANKSHATDVVLTFYGLFVLVAAGIPIVALLAAKPVAVGGLIAVFVAMLIELLAMATVYLLVEHSELRFSKWLAGEVLRTPSDGPRVPRPER